MGSVPRAVRVTDGDGRSVASAPGHSVVIDGWDDSPELTIKLEDRITDGAILTELRRHRSAFTVRGMADGLTGPQVSALSRTLRGMFHELHKPGVVEVNDFDVALFADVYLDGEIKTDIHPVFGWLRWEMPLVSLDARRYGTQRSTTVLPLVAGTGHAWPAFQHVNPGGIKAAEWGTGNQSGGPETVTNQGNATAWPVVTVSGDFPGGFRLTSGTRVVEFGFAVFPASPVVVDMAGSVWVGGAERSHWLRRRDWISVPPQGSASIALDPLAGGTGRAVIAVRDTWL